MDNTYEMLSLMISACMFVISLISLNVAITLAILKGKR